MPVKFETIAIGDSILSAGARTDHSWLLHRLISELKLLSCSGGFLWGF